MYVCMYALNYTAVTHTTIPASTNAAWWQEKLAASLRISMSNE